GVSEAYVEGDRAVDGDGPADGAVAAGEADLGWGYRITPAEVSFSRRYGAVGGTVTIDGSVALDVRLRDPEPVSGGDLELFDNLHLTNVEGEQPVIVQVDPSFAVTSADRGEADLATFEPSLLGIGGLEPIYPVVAVACAADMELNPPRFVMDPAVPAVQGTRRLSPA
ncbi:MAG: hypothetical protein AAFN30_14215, partial [Actinomycetota bacterium]